MSEGSLVHARAVDGDATFAEDIAARRLRELSQRLSAPATALIASDDGNLEKSDAEFEPVSLAAILAIGRRQTPDTADDTLVETTAGARPLVSVPALTDAPSPEPARADSHIEPATLPVSLVALEPPPPPLLLAGEVLPAPHGVPFSEPPEQVPLDPLPDNDAAPDENPPLLLADQSATDLRLVDLIRRQQSLLDQLNSFPPSYKAPEETAEAAPAAPVEAPRSVVELLAPPPTPPPEVEEAREARESDVKEEAPAPLPPPLKDTRREPPRLTAPVARERTDEPAAADLPQQSPKIIQRARAERSVRRGPAVAAPPSTVPAFLAGLAAALAVAGVLFVIL